jgi:hypothetical protein
MRVQISVLATVLTFVFIITGLYPANAWTPLSVKDDPLVRMPGTQPAPEGDPDIEAPGRCLNCHGGYNQSVEPGFNWQGSMMAHAARDFLYWSCLTLTAQDSIWAVGRPNATDICLRCHFPKGWLEGRSDPTNGSRMTGADFDGVQCDFCHSMFDPFFETTYDGTREGSDWTGYWDETTALSQTEALKTYEEDVTLAAAIKLFSGNNFFNNNLPPANYKESASGQYFVDDDRAKRASFADAAAKHSMFYSRYHKSKYFCATCHDVSNPVLANLGADPTQPLPTELNSAYSYFHAERTFSEFMLSAYGQQGGAPGIGPFAPGVFETSLPNNNIGKCQDCHMRDVSGVGSNKQGTPTRPYDPNDPNSSTEHPQSGQPLHDLTGGNAWVSYVLASAVSGSPNYDSVNDSLLNQGSTVLTLDLNQGLGIDPVALLAGVERAKQQLRLAASIQNLSYNPSNGTLSFRVQNQAVHKLISGFPEGRRMFVNIKAFAGGTPTPIYEVNPYDYTVGTLKGLPNSPNSPTLGPNEAYVDELVYEMHPSSTLTGEDESFHFALATGRYKDNRIPPKGFDIANAGIRLAEAVWHGVSDDGVGGVVDYYTTDEYAGGYDDVDLADYPLVAFPENADYVEVNLYYQTTSREYIEFLRDEIKGTGHITLPTTVGVPGPGDPNNYIIQSTDQQNSEFFGQLKAWGDTIWDLWTHNMNVDGAAPFLMAQATFGTPPTPCNAPTPTLQSAVPSSQTVTLTWSDESADPNVIGYKVYYDQAGKAQLVADTRQARPSW